ncbi:hypothetical protein RhiXN_00957 [Rhizoctonia solani]|uniref:BTB domain-containing protein n=1 Tax=Rhizoctonia solani TaxID=456999 RepID=A0A8H8NWA5_9AGAM|nr:uncharacterized protein RhiXN_00957 [Rhizoctonia solani]QRW19551.1 hypothetical protein RhiXN_00957 [Rhizoctonia solani]
MSSLLSLRASAAYTTHDLTGVCINLQVNNVTIKVHENQISKFAYLYELVKKARLANPQGDTLTICVQGGNELVPDFLNTFKILNTSPIDKSDNFGTDILVSAARIADAYKHPALRTFCIKRLEGLSMNSMERLRIGRALDLKSWKERAYEELIEQDEIITKADALTLRVDAYWKITSEREARSREVLERYKRVLFVSSSNNPSHTAPSSLKTTSLLPESRTSSTVHDLIGACINLQVNTIVIKTHEYQISNFAYMHDLVKNTRLVNAQINPLTICVTGGNELVSDFLNTFKILNTSSIDQPDNFDADTLVSAARVSASYKYPALRAFCIERLEGLRPSSMERLRIGRALDLKSWEERACQELVKREEIITKEEALQLKIDAYWQITSERETRIRQKLRNMAQCFAISSLF